MCNGALRSMSGQENPHHFLNLKRAVVMRVVLERASAFELLGDAIPLPNSSVKPDGGVNQWRYRVGRSDLCRRDFAAAH
jgi:hypothetical protein